MKTISSSFFTTTNFDSFVDSIVFLLNFRNRKHLNNWKYVKKIEDKLAKYLWVEEKSKIISFYNARSALHHWLKLFWIWKGDEVIIQAYTCVSVPNSIIQTWAKPIYVDIDYSLNIDVNKLEDKISKSTKAIVIQHTFGCPANINQIQNICKKHNIFLIEDCAHSLWAEYQWKKVWTFWDFAIFSSGRDKVISTVNWWFLVINNQEYFNNIKKIESELINIPTKLILKNLFYLIISYLSYKLYDFLTIWKALILFCKKLNLIPEILSCNEKKCQNTTFFYRYPNALAYIAIKEIEKIDKYNKKRIEITKSYNKIIDNSSKNSIYLRYIFLTDKPKELTKRFKQEKILLWDWYSQVIAPENTDYKNAWYQIWSCPIAEKIASQTLNLPCHPNLSDKDLNRVVEVLKKY